MSRAVLRAECWLAVAIAALVSGCAATPRPADPAPTPPTSATAGQQTIVAIAPPAPSGPTGMSLPEFLGIPQIFKGGVGAFRFLRDRLAARLGSRFPGLEPRPPVKLLTDPDNLSPDAPPSVQAAANVKEAEDGAAQKAKAAAYLATVGCGCYEGVAEALAENLRDCSEVVRHASVKALRDLGAKRCSGCGGVSCCTPEIHKELMRLAWEVDDTGCYVEHSPRVRRLARLALTTCGPQPEQPPRMPEEGPHEEEGQVLSQREDQSVVDPASLIAQQTPLLTEPALTEPALTEPALTEERPATSEGPVRRVHHVDRRPSRVLAEVNGQPVTSDQLLPEVRRRLVADAASAGQHWDRVLKEVLAETIDRKLLAQKGREVLSATVQRRLENQLTQTAGDAIDLLSAGPHTATKRLEAALAAELLRRQVDHDPFVAAAEIELHYQRHGERYRHPDEVRWQRHRIDASAAGGTQRALELARHARLLATGFEAEPPRGFDPALVHVEDHDWTAPADLPSAQLRRQLQSLGPGQATQLIGGDGDASFILVTQVRIGPRRRLAEVSSRIKADILADRRSEAEAAYVAQLRGQADIRILPEPSPATGD